MANITQAQCFTRIAALLLQRVPAFTASVKTTTLLGGVPNQGFGLNSSGIAALAGPLQAAFSGEGLLLSSGELAFAKPDTVWELAGVVAERVRNVTKAEVAKRVIACIKAVLGSATVVSAGSALGSPPLNMSSSRKGQFAKELNHVFTTTVRLGLSPTETNAGTTVEDWIDLCSQRFNAQSRLI